MEVSENLKRGVTEIVLAESATAFFGFVKIPLPSCRFASSHLPQGDGFSSGGKLSGIAIRRPLGGAVAAGD